jgi:hypothetical protein
MAEAYFKALSIDVLKKLRKTTETWVKTSGSQSGQV